MYSLISTIYLIHSMSQKISQSRFFQIMKEALQLYESKADGPLKEEVGEVLEAFKLLTSLNLEDVSKLINKSFLEKDNVKS